MGGRHGECGDAQSRPPWAIDDGTADRGSYAHPGGFGGEEGLEDPFNRLPLSSALKGNAKLFILSGLAILPISRGSHILFPLRGWTSIHRLT
jgi:hypothetical protein